MQTKAFIVDDLDQARKQLKNILNEKFNSIEIVGEANSVITAAKQVQQSDFDILFLDIDLGDGTGFDLLEIIGPKPKFKVIFTTGMDNFAIKAFKLAAVDYLLKPIDPDELSVAIEKAIQMQRLEQEQFQMIQDFRDKKPTEKIAIHTQEKIHILPTVDIVRIEAESGYSTFFLRSGQKIMVSKTLKEYDNLLKDTGFLRVHQSHLVNAQFISEFDKRDGGSISLTNGDWIPVSTRKKAFVMDYLNAL